MGYCTQADFSARFGADELLQLTDRDRDGTPDAGVFDDAVSDASAEIDSYLTTGGRIALPLASVPPVLVRVACDIARYRLYAQRASQEVLDRYNQAVQWLVNVSKGLVSLGVDPPPAASAQADDALVSTDGRTFDRDSLSDYMQPGRRR